jgi:hypothetical protein
MENQIICPHCQRKISNNSIIEDAAKHSGSDTQILICECGERITYWKITAQLRDQKKTGVRFQNWLRSLSKVDGKER